MSNFKEIASVQSSPSHFHIEKGDIGNSAIPPLEDDRSLRVGKLLRYSCNCFIITQCINGRIKIQLLKSAYFYSEMY